MPAPLRLTPPVLIGNARRIVVLAGLYAVLGKLSLMLAVDPGYASPFFPSAGLSVAALLAGGNSLLPGVMLGSFILNLWGAFESGATSALSTLIAISISFGAASQALLGAGLVKRCNDCTDLNLEDERSILKFLILAGPVSCLISATWGVTSLLLAGTIPNSAWLFSWWNWYLGDVIGVLIFAPVTLMLLKHAHPLWHARLKSVLPIMLATSAGIITLFHFSKDNHHKEIESRLTADAHLLHFSLQSEILAHEELISALGRLQGLGGDSDKLQALAQQSMASHADILALSWNPIVAHQDRPAFEHRMRSELKMPGYRITEIDQHAQLIAAAERTQYIPVAWIVPRLENQVALGYDIGSEPVRLEALKFARETGKISASNPIALVQDATPNGGFLIVYPVTRDTGTGAVQLIGYSTGVFSIGQMISHRITPLIPDGAKFLLSTESINIGSSLPITQMQKLSSSQVPRATVEIPLADRNWMLTLYATSGYLARHESMQSWLVLVLGLSLASLLQALLLGMTGKQSIVLRKVKETTSMLVDREYQLLKSQNQLQVVLDNMPAMIGYWNNQLINEFGNKAYLDWFGYTPEEMRGRHIREIIGEQLFAMNLPYIESALRGEPQQFERFIVDVKGVRRCSLATYIPDLAGSTINGFFVLVMDITRQKNIELELQESERLNRTILQTTQEGFLLINKSGQILSANPACCDTLGYEIDELLLMSSEQLGLTPHLFHTQPTLRLESKLQRSDGQSVEVELTINYLADDEEYFCFISDITERKRFELNRLKQVEVQRDTLVREVHHRIKNNLQGMIGLLNLQLQTHPETADVIQDVIGKISSVALVFGLRGESNENEIRLCEILSEVCSITQRLTEHQLDVDIPSSLHVTLSQSTAVPIALVVNELITNAIKHSQNNHVIKVRFSHSDNVAIVVIENTSNHDQVGSLLDEAISGIGLKLTQSMLPSEGAELSVWQQEKSVRAELRLSSPTVNISVDWELKKHVKNTRS